MLGAHGVMAMSPEVGPEEGGFWPDPRKVSLPSARDTYDRIMAVVLKSGPSVRVAGVGLAAITGIRRDTVVVRLNAAVVVVSALTRLSACPSHPHPHPHSHSLSVCGVYACVRRPTE
eukprot:GHVU01094724.1.p2 GENE.GHVU01094724.1~~GHVU01094724.1.p2  ORF type:complete len:117 (-),score=9.91 GHVU01094724.1:416-766(-)